MKIAKQVRLKVFFRTRKSIFIAVRVIHRLLCLLPPRLSYFCLVILAGIQFPGRKAFYLAFKPIAAKLRQRDPGFRLSSKFSRIFPEAASNILYEIGSYEEACDEIEAKALGLKSIHASVILGRSLFELGKFDEARGAIAAKLSSAQLDFRPEASAFKAKLDLIAGDEDEAVRNLERACMLPKYLSPHQNMAGRYPSVYAPTNLDRNAGPDGRLYDAYNYVGQRVTHVGMGELGAQMYSGAFRAQAKLRSAFPELSPKLKTLLADLDISLEELRIVPVEWFTQIGHLGMLDMLFRMRDIGWWSGKVIFLVPSDLVANHQFLKLYERDGIVLTPGGSVSTSIAREFFSLQRWCGLSFNAFELPSGKVVPWQEAGALMIRQWEREGRGYPVREEFDRTLGSSSAVRNNIATLRKAWGMKPDDWYVCLHMRDAAHYDESPGTGQTHRNAQAASYLDFVEYITAKGGWIIKLGGTRSPKLPKMKRLIDYARSKYRSDVADLDLIRHARLFVGTTSGLTNVAVSFGIPSAIVNCITTDAQLWGDRVRFVPKRVELKDGKVLTQHDLTSTPWRWRVFDAEVLGRFGARPLNNTSDEILETVKEVEAMANGTSDKYLATVADAESLLETWKSQLGLSHFYGNALPSRYFLQKHRKTFLNGTDVNATESARMRR
jgi:putative glycosyltransferase (TIGR04372 family)